MAVTERDIVKVKNEALEIRDQVVSAKSTLQSVTDNINNYKKELEQLGVNPDDVEAEITALEAEIKKLFDESVQTINDWNEKISNR